LLVIYYLSRAQSRFKWKKKKLATFQIKKLRQVINYAYENVPFYQRLLKSKKIYPGDIKNLRDLNKIPIVRKADLRKNSLSDLISTGFSIDSLKKLTSGGSTGEPFSVYINNKEDAWRKAIYLRANISCGQKPRDIWACVIDSQYSNYTSKMQEILGFFHRRIVPITLDKHDRFKAVERIAPDILDGFPSALCSLAKQQEKKEKRVQPKIIFGSGELITENSIKLLERTFKAQYFDQYGCTEIDRSAWQCQEHIGYHMDVDSVITQFVDENGEEVGSNEKGEIVYTSLFNYAFPIIRYNIEDVGVPINHECSCGIQLPMMKIIEGRSNDSLIFPDNQVFTPIRFIELLGAFKLEEEIEQYQVIQQKKDLIRIILKKTNEKIDEKKVETLLQNNLLQITNSMSNQNKDINFEIIFKDKLSKTPRGKLKVVTSKLRSNKFF
jgi:phenylacetate-CoA ligase